MEKFKPFWIVTVNRYICGASYSGKELKAKHWVPTFREFHFIRDENDLDFFNKRGETTNKQLVSDMLNSEAPARNEN